MNRIPLLVPHMPSADDVLPYLRQIDSNRHYTNFGPLNLEFEQRLSRLFDLEEGKQFITTVSNCTLGLELALLAHRLPKGARVLVPSITFAATATSIARVGLTPVFSDVDEDCWQLTPDIARDAHSKGLCDAVMPVATYGLGQDATAWDLFSEQTALPVIIDAAGAIGNQNFGKLADVVFSFHATKSLGAAEGGAVISGSPTRVENIRKLSNFGIDTSLGLVTEIGTNAKMSEYHCALGLASLDSWKDTMQQRRTLMNMYRAQLREDVPGIRFQAGTDDGVFPILPVLLPQSRTSIEVGEILRASGIETRRWYCPGQSQHPAFAESPRVSERLPVADMLSSQILGLPFFIGMNEAQIKRVTNSLAEALSA